MPLQPGWLPPGLLSAEPAGSRVPVSTENLARIAAETTVTRPDLDWIGAR
jgi:hypothetical protein